MISFIFSCVDVLLSQDLMLHIFDIVKVFSVLFLKRFLCTFPFSLFLSSCIGWWHDGGNEGSGQAARNCEQAESVKQTKVLSWFIPANAREVKTWLMSSWTFAWISYHMHMMLTHD
jgi:hypothetical protein